MGFSNGQVSVGSSTTEIAAANGDRKYLRIQNISDEAVYLGIGADAVSQKGVYLASGGAGVYEVSPANGNFTTEAINGICASGSKLVVVLERTA